MNRKTECLYRTWELDWAHNIQKRCCWEAWRILLSNSVYSIITAIVPTVRAFGVIRILISDPRSIRSWCIKGTDESTLVRDWWVPLMHHDPSDLWSLILIQTIPKECTLTFCKRMCFLPFHRKRLESSFHQDLWKKALRWKYFHQGTYFTVFLWPQFLLRVCTL